MSLGYAEKLSARADLGGQLGLQEYFDRGDECLLKVKELVAMMKQAQNLVIFTGAGISTSCGIPDFRGPRGIWTLQKAGLQLPKSSTSFEAAKPSFTHMALKVLLDSGVAKFVISQNVDGLCTKCGISRDKLSELHGNVFVERCPKCKVEYVRDFEIETIGLKRTKRSCSTEGCNGRLVDTTLDWEQQLPEPDYSHAIARCKDADMVLVLGSSLQITPARNLPFMCKEKSKDGKVALVNLQKTPMDIQADLLIHQRCDAILKQVLYQLGLQVPPYTRHERVVLYKSQYKPIRCQDEFRSKFDLSLESGHGAGCRMPLLQSVDFCVNGQVITVTDAPYRCQYTLDPGKYNIDVTLHLNHAADEDKKAPTFSHKVTIEDLESWKEAMNYQKVGHLNSQEVFDFISQYTTYDVDRSEHDLRTLQPEEPVEPLFTSDGKLKPLDGLKVDGQILKVKGKRGRKKKIPGLIPGVAGVDFARQAQAGHPGAGMSQQLGQASHMGGVGHLGQDMMGGQGNPMFGREGMGGYSNYAQGMQQQFPPGYGYGMNMYGQQTNMHQQLEQLQQQSSLGQNPNDDKLKQLQLFMYLYQQQMQQSQQQHQQQHQQQQQQQYKQMPQNRGLGNYGGLQGFMPKK